MKNRCLITTNTIFVSYISYNKKSSFVLLLLVKSGVFILKYLAISNLIIINIKFVMSRISQVGNFNLLFPEYY